MARKVNHARQDAWRQRIERQRESGRSIAEFCRSEGISQASFHTWKRKLRIGFSQEHPRGSGRSAAAMAPRQRGREPGRTAGGDRQSRIVPAAAQGPFLELPVRRAQSSPWIELALADGTVVRLPQQNTAALIAVLRILRGEPLDSFRSEDCHA